MIIYKKFILALIVIVSIMAITGCSDSWNGYPTRQAYVDSTLVSYSIIGVTMQTKNTTNSFGAIIKQRDYYTVLYCDSSGNQNCETFNTSNDGINLILSTENRLDKTCDAVYLNLTAETINSTK